jgi:serine/threonine-protein kinase
MNESLPDDGMAGSRLGHYAVEGLLGEGGMGKVYKAIGPDGTRVALKLIKADFARDDRFRRRFNREAKIAQTVKHPNVVPVLDTGEAAGLPFMAQQFIDGPPLDVMLKRAKVLDVPTTVRVCTDVAAGLEALWAAGIVHRDVKPSNILLDEHGTAHITDFGLAKDTQGSLLTLPGQALGSMDYMSPEQIRGEPVSAASDIYALGCVMYECICGRPPFAHKQGMRVLWAHLQDEPPDPVSLRGELSPEFVHALSLALAKVAGERPATAGDYARLLTAAAENSG